MKQRASVRTLAAGGTMKRTKQDRIDAERNKAERLEQQRIDFEHRARMARTNLYNNVPPRDPTGWVDTNRK